MISTLLLLHLLLSSAWAFTHTRSTCVTHGRTLPNVQPSSSLQNSNNDTPTPITATSQPLASGLTILMPAYNEENRIEEKLQTYTQYIANNPNEFPKATDILVVDDGSTDDTANVVLSLHERTSNSDCVVCDCISLPTNMGKGEAVARGIQEICARHEDDGAISDEGCHLVLVADADGSGDISCASDMQVALAELIQRRHGGTATKVGTNAVMIVGDRGYEGAGPARAVLRWGFRTAVRLLCGNLGVSDTQCGMKLMTLDAAAVLYCDLNLKRWTHDVEVLYRAKLRGVPVADIPIKWEDKEGSKLVTSAGGAVGASARMLLEILQMRVHYVLGNWKV